jgi:sodium pump decarboxylase gamma subunit
MPKMDSDLIYALKISGVGIVVLLLVLVVLAGVVSLMTKFIVEKPEKEEDEEENAEPAISAEPEKKSNLETVAAIALALYRAQTEIQTSETTAPAGEINSWRQFNLQRRLTQSSTIRRSR